MRYERGLSQRLMRDIVGIADGEDGFLVFARMLRAAGIAETLHSEGPYTVFAPTDAAFARMPEGALEALLADPERLTATMMYHVVTGRLTVGNIIRTGGSTPPSVGGQRLTIKARDGKVFVDGAMVVRADVAASNGIVHGIDSLMAPQGSESPAGH